jgi:hypothetical protein
MDAPIGSIVIDAGNNRHLRDGVSERLNRGAIGLDEQELPNARRRARPTLAAIGSNAHDQ